MPDRLRRQLQQLLDWEDAHASFDAAVDGVPAELRGAQPEGLPYSPWQLLEHLRLTQRDILEFCRSPSYEEMAWPDDYWPEGVTPPSPDAWECSIEDYRADRAALKDLVADAAVDLHAPVPHGNGQTYLREILLVADHTSYHVGQLVAVRRLLGIWPS